MTILEKFDEMYANVDFKRNPFGVGWRVYHEDREPVYRLIKEFILRGRVLDLGGGFGYFSRYVDRSLYFNFDISRNIMRFDKSDFRVLGTGTCLPYMDNSFTNVVSYGVLRYVSDWHNYLSECYRVLVFGGRLVLVTIKKPKFDWKRMIGIVGDKANIGDIEIYDKYWSRKELSGELVKVGFKVIYHCVVGKYYPFVFLVGEKYD